MKDDSLMFERISDMMVQFCNVLKDALSTAKHATISIEVGQQMMIDARTRARAQDIVTQVNAILALHDESEGSHVGVRVYERNPIYILRRFFAKIVVNMRRLWLSHGILFYIALFATALTIYPLVSLLLLGGVGVYDTFIGIWMIVFFPFLYVTMSLVTSMADRYRQFYIELEDGIFGCFSIHATFVTFYCSLAIAVTSIAYFSLFIIRPDTGLWEVYDGSMML